MAEPVVEIREPGKAPARVTVTGTVEVGREGTDVVLSDDRVSRRHLALTVGDEGVAVADLGSANGTFVNGHQISRSAVLRPGDRVRLGRTELELVSAAPSPRPAPTGSRAALDELDRLETDGAVVRYRPGTAGAEAAKGVAAAARRARRRLEGFGSQPWGAKVQICLVDPFPDPEQPGAVVAGGTLVDAARGEIWMVVTSESPPEQLERPLTLLFGGGFPASDDLRFLLDGYGLHLAGTGDPDPTLRTLALPPLVTAEDELGSTMALSFVRYLLERDGADSFLRLLASAQPGRLDEAMHEVYGLGSAALEEAWQAKLRAGAGGVRPRVFLRLALRYLRPHRRREAEIFLYMLLSLVFTLAFPFVTRGLVDSAIPSGELARVVSLLGVLGVAFAVSLLASLRRTYLSAYVSSSVVRRIRAGMFERLQSLSPSWFQRHEEGDVLARFFSDVGQLELGISQILREGAFQLLTLVASGIVLLFLSPLLGGLVLLGAPLVALVYRAMGKGALRRSLAVQEQTGAVLSVGSENYAAQPVVKAFGLERREVHRFDRASERLFRAEVRLQLFGGLFELSVNTIVIALRLAVIGLGAWLIVDGRFTIGGLVALMGVMGEVLSPVATLTQLGQQLQASGGALQRVNEILDETPEIVDAHDAVELPAPSRELRFRDVSFSYTPEQRALDDVDLAIEAGHRVAFVGPSGSGKSSILRLVMRFYDPDEGAVLFDGCDTRQATLASLRAQLGVVFQDTFVFNATIRENIRTGRVDASDADVERAARAAELHDFVTTLARGYDTLVGEQGGRLSGGQRQRLAIARALVRDPAVLLLDEATSALDPRTERLVANTIVQVSEGRTTIAVTHRLTSVVDYDRIFVVVGGRVVEDGTHNELVRRGGAYAALWSEQTAAVTVEPVFDATAALARLPLFEELEPAELDDVAQRLARVELRPGERLAEGDGLLALVGRGHADVLGPGIGGGPEPVAELGPGDAFGLAALLGQARGSELRARDRVELLVLDEETIAALAAAYRPVAIALEGARAPRAAPVGGARLSRVSMAVRGRGGGAGALRPDEGASRGPEGADISRVTGSFPRLG